MRARLVPACLSALALSIAILGTAACQGSPRAKDVAVRTDALEDFDEAAWEKLGERRIVFARESDTIHATLADGRSSRLTLVVRDTSITFFDVVVTFEDGSVYAPNARLLFSPEVETYVLELPGGAKEVRKLAFRYRTPSAYVGFTDVELFGQR